jgi:small multidrug resistance family-3 protein
VVSHDGNVHPAMTFLTWIIFFAAALLEVGGDAAIRRGLRGGGMLSLLAGFVVLGFYGLVVNSVKWDFSKLLGSYVALFALVSVLCGRYVFRESIPVSTWIGLAIIMIGGLIIQLGHR